MSKKNKKNKPSVKVVSEEELENQNLDSIQEDTTPNEPIPNEVDNALEVDPLENEESNEVIDSSTNEELPVEDIEADDILDEENSDNLQEDQDQSDFISTEDEPVEDSENTLNEDLNSFGENGEMVDEENTTLPPVEEIHDHEPPAAKKPMDKKQKKILIISILSFVLVVAIVLSIALPIYFFYKGKVMIDTQEDFQNVSKGSYYVLNKDVTVTKDLDLSTLGNYSIDLNGHTLNIEGNLKYAADKEFDINIGNIKKKQYVKGGTLIIKGSLIVEAPSANLNLLSATTVNDAVITTKSSTINVLGAFKNVDINSANVTIDGSIETEPTSFVNISNANVIVNGCVKSTLNGMSISLATSPATTIDKLELDDKSNAQINGTITSSISGGNKVAMMAGHSCGEYNNIKNLALYRESAKDYTIRNCERVVYVDKLTTPADFIIEDRANGKIFAVATKVPNASGYKYTIDNNPYDPLGPDNGYEWDISQLMADGGPGKHIITVTPLGNFDFETFDKAPKPIDPNDDIQYVDGDSASTEYAYKIKLDTPENLKVDTSNDNVTLSFNTVSFASNYEIAINGEAFTIENDATAKVQSISIKDKVANVGLYSIKVKATSIIPEIEESKQAMTSYSKYEKLAAPSAIAKISGETLMVTYEVPEHATSFIIYAQDIAGNKIELGRTALKEFSIEAEKVNGFSNIVVIAQGYGFYQTSDESITEIIKE